VSHDLLGAYALDAVTSAERLAVERHVATCDECTRELAEMRGSLTRMALSELTPVEPSPQFTAAVFAAVQAAAPVPARGLSAWVRRQSARIRPSFATPSWPRLAVGLASFVLVLASVATVMQVRVAAERDRADRITAVLAAPDARLATVSATGGGTVTVAYSPGRGSAVVTASDLARIDPDRAYQLWLIKDGAPTSVGLLAAGAPDGVRIVDGIAGAQTIGVTNEPAKGSAVPTLPMVAAVPL
jgi:anti-sigma factor RsiW